MGLIACGSPLCLGVVSSELLHHSSFCFIFFLPLSHITWLSPKRTLVGSWQLPAMGTTVSLHPTQDRAAVGTASGELLVFELTRSDRAPLSGVLVHRHGLFPKQHESPRRQGSVGVDHHSRSCRPGSRVMRYSPDGQFLAAGSRDGHVAVLHVDQVMAQYPCTRTSAARTPSCVTTLPF